MSEQHAPFYEQVGVAMTCRSYEEYVRMFDLPETLEAYKSVLDVAGGASSFTASISSLGIDARAVDPKYALEPDEMERHALHEIEASTAKLAKVAEHYVWDYYGSLEQHRENRIRSLAAFMNQYREHEGRTLYTSARLPELPFNRDQFGLVLCSHFLFLYAGQFDEAFHLAALRELVRVCRKGGEVRIYPLVDFKYDEHPHLTDLLRELEADGVRHERAPTRLPFLPKSTDLLILRK